MLPQFWKCGTGAGIEERKEILRAEKGAGNGARAAQPIQIDDRGGKHRENSLAEPVQVREIPAKNGACQTARGRAGGAVRKYLQNDELIEYAFTHSDLFIPSRA